MKLYEYAQVNDDFYNYISADYGLKEWSDPLYYYLYKYAPNVDAIPYLALNAAWGGVIGEDGLEGTRIGPEEPEGETFSEVH